MIIKKITPAAGEILAYLFLLISSPFWIPLVAMLCLVHWVLLLKQRLIGPGYEFSRWFAWHPVTIAYQQEYGFDVDRVVWLEFVYRRSSNPKYPLAADVTYQARRDFLTTQGKHHGGS